MPLTSVSGEGPQPLGHYSQAIRAGGFVFVSTQLPIPRNGEAPPCGPAAEAAQALTNVEAILATCRAGLSDLVRATLYLTDIADYAEVNRIYAERLGSHRPARGVVGVAALHRGYRVAIEAIAIDRHRAQR